MDLSKFSQTEKLALFGSVAVIVGALVGSVSAIMWLALLAAIGMLLVLLLPAFSPSTSLPGSRGSLMLICGAVATAAVVIALLTVIGALGFLFQIVPVTAIFFLVAVAGGLVMGWAGWQAFQGEGGNFAVGSPSSGTTRTTTFGSDAHTHDTTAPDTHDHPPAERRNP